MPTEHDMIRERLLGRLPLPGDMAAYREGVEATLEKNQKNIRRERLLVMAFWIFCVVSATSRIWFSADSARLPRGPFLACIFFTWGGVEIVKHYINSCRVDLLKEIKQLQVQVFELENFAIGRKSPVAGDFHVE